LRRIVQGLRRAAVPSLTCRERAWDRRFVDSSRKAGLSDAASRRATLLALALFASCPVCTYSQPQPVTTAPPAVAAPSQPPAVIEPEPGPEFATPTTLDRAGRIIAPVEINGRGPFRFILDTGANRSAMSAATATAIGIVPSLDAQVSVHGITGSATLPIVTVTHFRVGELMFVSQRLPVLPSAVFGEVDGILGIDLLQEARIEVDFERDRVTISRSSGRSAPEGYLVVPARRKHGGLLLVKGRVGRVPVKAILDTGAERSLGNGALREALSLKVGRPRETAETTVIGATAQVAKGVSFVAPDVDIGGVRITDLVVTFGDLHVFTIWSLLEEPALLIGMDLLGTVPRFVVDYRRREFQFKPSSEQSSIGRCRNARCQVRIPPLSR